MDKFSLGWSQDWDSSLSCSSEENLVRITARHRGLYHGLTPAGEQINVHLRGKLLHECVTNATLPAVGDWCLIGSRYLDETNETSAPLELLLPRRSQISRMVTGIEADEQILAANIDYVFIVTSANKNFNINRLRRYIILAEHGRAKPVVVLSKVDLVDYKPDEYTTLMEHHLPGIQYVATSSLSSDGTEQVEAMLSAGQTAVFVGSSGVGKSTLVNSLLNSDIRRIGAIRENDCKGRHTTSSAGLFFTETGGMIIDTPGLREVHVLGDAAQLDQILPSVKDLAGACRFSDCSHTSEPDCQIQLALQEERLSQADLNSYFQLERELAYSKRKLDKLAAAEERNKWKKINVAQRRNKLAKRGEAI